MEELEGEPCREVPREDEGVEEQPLRRRTLLRVLGQGDLHETAKWDGGAKFKVRFTVC